jgi:hypothetical protein
MNDKKFIKVKIKKSLRKLMGKVYLSKYELIRLNLLSNLVSSILITGDSRINKLATANTDRKNMRVKKQN